MAKSKKEKSRYNSKELKEFKVIISDKLKNAKEQLDFYMKNLSDRNDNSDASYKGLEDGVSSMESERLTIMAGRQKKLIQHLENALIRVDNQVYGICRETGKLISKERLKAVPHATLSIHAKQSKFK